MCSLRARAATVAPATASSCPYFKAHADSTANAPSRAVLLFIAPALSNSSCAWEVPQNRFRRGPSHFAQAYAILIEWTRVTSLAGSGQLSSHNSQETSGLTSQWLN